MVMNTPGRLRARTPRPAAPVWCALATLVALSLAGCITVPTGGGDPTATQGPTAPQTFVDRLKATAVAPPSEGATELPQFITDSRNIACVFTTSRAGHLNQPWEPNNFNDAANATAPTLPVVSCQMVSYPQVQAADVRENCAGTFVGYLGGVATLLPDKASYGGCRAGVSAVEAAFGARGTVNQVMGSIPVLAPGAAMESQGYRCAPLDDGVACANLASGVGFFVAAEKYELFGAGQPTKQPTSSPTAAAG
ncbi:hypothetical protein ACX80E_08600 [Arthrobacter sp. TMN-49]